MTCPFPGMDPYVERREIWTDFHNSLIAAIRGVLQPSLRPRYAAITEEILYVVEADRAIRPDVSIVRATSPYSQHGGTVLLEPVEAPTVFELEREEIRQPLIHIIEPAAGNRLVTAIEVLSPDNKAAGPGRRTYLRKRDEVLNADANLVEIDLLRAGRRTFGLSPEKRASLAPHHYLVAVTRQDPYQQELYAVPLQRKLPRIAIPLAEDDRDVLLDLQAAFTRCWDEGPYPAMLQYEQPPPGNLTPDEVAWCSERLRAAGMRA